MRHSMSLYLKKSRKNVIHLPTLGTPFKHSFFFPRYSKGANELQPSTLQTMQVSGDNSTILMKLEPDRIVPA